MERGVEEVGVGAVTSWGQGVSLSDGKVLKLERWWLHNTVNAINANEWYTIK